MAILERLLRPSDGTVAALWGLVVLYAIVGAWFGNERSDRRRFPR